MAVRKAGNGWLVEFMQAGHRVFKRLPTEATRKDALDYETKLRREIFDQATLGKRPEVTLEYAIRQWLKEVNKGRKSERATESHANQVLCLCKSGVGIGGGGIADLSVVIKGSAVSPATANRRLCILKAVAKFAWKKGWTEENLSARITLLTESNARQVYLSSDQVETLLATTPDYAMGFVALAVYTGLRQGEILALQPEDVVGTVIRVRDSKTGSPREVPIIPNAAPYLLGLPFTLHRRTLYAGFEEARAAIGMPHLRYHDLRHTTASLMIQAGVPLYTVGEILGHKSTQTTKRYAHLAEGDKRKALERAFPIKITATPYPVNEDK